MRVLGSRYLRVNHSDDYAAAFLNLDVADDRARFKLLDAASTAAKAAYLSHRTFIDRMLNRHLSKPVVS